MGLEIVELILRVEEDFGIEIGDGDGEAMLDRRAVLRANQAQTERAVGRDLPEQRHVLRSAARFDGAHRDAAPRNRAANAAGTADSRVHSVPLLAPVARA